MDAKQGGLQKRSLPRLNFRPLLIAAVGLICGIVLTLRIRFGGLCPSDFVFFGLFLFAAIFSFSLKRMTALVALFALFAGIGAGLFSAYADGYADARFFELPVFERGDVTGTVVSASEKDGFCVYVLDDIVFEYSGKGQRRQDGKLTFSGTYGAQIGDIVALQARVSAVDVTQLSKDDMVRYYFAKDIRYYATSVEYSVNGKTQNPFLLLNRALRERLYSSMSPDGADVAYALLTGNSGNMEAGLSDTVRRGGIAHIFAVSGLHIGILFAAIAFVFKKLGKWRVLPAVTVCLCYSALCAFSVSSLRAVIMCGVLGIWTALGKKSDFLSSISFAAAAVLMIFPAQWLSAGFRLSFGACLGLALFQNTLARKLRFFPPLLANYLSANLSVQAVTFPVLIESFGYWSLWGTLVNFFLIPALPVLFLGLLVCALFALCIPPAAAFFLTVPEGMISLLLWLFAVFDFTAVLSGFSLGTGAVVWMVGCVALCGRFRLGAKARAGMAVGFAAVFTVCVLFENAVFYGCKIITYPSADKGALLARTQEDCVLVLSNDLSLSRSRQFLEKNYSGKLSAVVVLGDKPMNIVNVAAFLPAECIYVAREVDSGLRETEVIAAQDFTVGEMAFHYLSGEKLMLFYEGLAVEIDFTAEYGSVSADLFLGNNHYGLKYFLHDGIIYTV